MQSTTYFQQNPLNKQFRDAVIKDALIDIKRNALQTSTLEQRKKKV